MPIIESGFEYNEKRAEELRNEIKELDPEGILKEFRTCAHWPISSEHREVLGIISASWPWNKKILDQADRLCGKLQENSSDFVNHYIIDYLKPLIYKTTNEVVDDKDSRDNSEEGIQSNKWLLGSRKSVFGTPDTEPLVERLKGVHEAYNELVSSENFKDKVDGLVVGGSNIKGYSNKESDLDYLLLTSSKEIGKKFKELLKEKGISPCCKHALIYDYGASSAWTNCVLFDGQGLFLGDFDKLREYQINYINNIQGDGLGEHDWRMIRKLIFEIETGRPVETSRPDFYRFDESLRTENRDIGLRKRLNVNMDELKKRDVVSVIMNVPPAELREAKEYLNKHKPQP